MKRLNMKRPQKSLTTKDIEKLETVVNQIEKLQASINSSYQKLNDIKEEHAWLNYLGEEAMENLSNDENYRLNNITEKSIIVWTLGKKYVYF